MRLLTPRFQQFSQLLLTIVASCTLFAAETVLPPAAVTAMDKLEKSENKLTTDYKKAVVTQRIKTIGELEKVMKEVTKSGDLVLALAVKSKIDELMAKNDAENDTDLLGNKKSAPLDPAKLIVGMWDYQKTNTVTGTIEFMPSGNFTATVITPIKYPFIPGKWEIKGEKVVITWLGDETKVDTLTFTAIEKLVGDTHDLGKDSFTASKPAPK